MSDPDEIRSCKSKFYIGDKRAAKRRARLMRLRHGDQEGQHLRAYKCQFCDGWHVGGTATYAES